MAIILTRSTALNEATPRFAILGTTTFTNFEGGVQVSTSNAAATDKYGGVIFHWTDANNYAQAELHLALGDTFIIRTVVAGTPTTIAAASEPHLASNTFYRIKVVCLASGNVVAQVLNQTETQVLAEVRASSSLLATGGTLASGKAGFSDQSTGTTAATRSYDSWYAAVPTPDAALYSLKQGELRYDGYIRQDSAGTVWAGKTVEGDYLAFPPAGREARSAEFFLRLSRGDPDTMFDSALDPVGGTAFATPRYLNVPAP